MSQRESLLHLRLQPVIDGISSRLLEGDAAPPWKNSPAVHGACTGYWLIDVAVGHQLVGLVADIGDFDRIVANLPADCEVPLLAVRRREIGGPAIDIQKPVVEYAVRKSNRRESL